MTNLGISATISTKLSVGDCNNTVAAFDSVDRLALWKALRSTGVPEVLLHLIMALHENMSASLKSCQADSAHPLVSGKVAF